MTIEELYAAARTAELLRETHDSRHRNELYRLQAAEATDRSPASNQARIALRRLWRSAS